MDDNEIERLAAQLGEADADRSDPDLTAHAVLARLRAEAAARRPWWRRAGMLRVAAAAVIVAAAAVAAQRAFGPGTGVPQFPTPPELRELAAQELAEVLDTLKVAAPVAELVSVSLEDLTEVELRQLLDWMES